MNRNMGRLAVAAVLLCAPAQAREGESSVLWRRMAETDSVAALRLINDNHPGARPELGDALFQQRLETAERHVRQRLPEVQSFEGYSAVMAGLAADFADGHIWSRPLVKKTTVQWTGALLTREALAWRVGAFQPQPGMPDIQDARLIACDGVEAETWADTRIMAFVAGAPNEAQRAEAAARLLIDDGNPFLSRPEQCEFETVDGERETVAFRWSQSLATSVDERIAALQRKPENGYALTARNGGYWIRLSRLDSKAEAVVAAVAAAELQLREAPSVVLDLRGNGGGDSRYGELIASVLFDEARVEAARRRVSDCQGAYWRASPENIEALKVHAGRNAGMAEVLGEMIEGMEVSASEGKAFWPDLPACAAHADLTDDAPRAPVSRRVVLVTDRYCFSSCLIVADLFRKLGALHVGEATDVSSRYMEVRTVVLPSGLRNFSTLQKVAVGLPDFGPFQPDIPFPGVMADDQALGTWLEKQLQAP